MSKFHFFESKKVINNKYQIVLENDNSKGVNK